MGIYRTVLDAVQSKWASDAILYFLSWEITSKTEKSNYCLVIKSFLEFPKKNKHIFLILVFTDVWCDYIHNREALIKE